MSQSISGDKEVIRNTEYDPLGMYVRIGGDIQHHLQEAHSNFLPDEQEKLSELGRKARETGTLADKAAAFDHFIECADSYWLGQWERFEKQSS